MWTLLYRAAWTALRAALPVVAGGDSKLARSLRGRRDGALALAGWASHGRDTERPLVWFHAASVGEGRQAEAVLVPLRAAHPDWQVVFTHSSASAEKLARSMPADFAGYLPADTATDTALALDALKPSALVFAATDLWPELVRQARMRGVPLVLVSATLAPTSSRRGGFASVFLRETYAALDRVGAIDERDAAALRGIGVRADAIEVTGDTRHDSAAARVAAIDRSSAHVAALLSVPAPVIVAGSTWPADEAELLPALARVRAAHPFALVIAPHEPGAAHLASLESGIARLLPGARTIRLSALERATSPWDVCLVDRVGILAELYAAAAIAFVGGGFHGAGLHSVIEPAALGVPVVFGPRWESSRDARLLQEAGGGRPAAGEAELAAVLAHWLGDARARAAAGVAALAVVEKNLGAAARSVQIVEEAVEASNRQSVES